MTKFNNFKKNPTHLREKNSSLLQSKCIAFFWGKKKKNFQIQNWNSMSLKSKYYVLAMYTTWLPIVQHSKLLPFHVSEMTPPTSQQPCHQTRHNPLAVWNGMKKMIHRPIDLQHSLACIFQWLFGYNSQILR